MQVIVSHINLDFDGLASMLAAKKLYPKAKMVLPEKLSIPVQQFLAIYRDALELYAPKQIDWSSVTNVIMVDIANLERIGNFNKQLLRDDLLPRNDIQFTVYDHHQPNEVDIKTDFGNVELLGATVTMLIEEIRRQQLSISAFEATVMALGIYTDTGSFTYLGTTARDLKAASFLLEQGANLATVASFGDRPLLDEQQRILNALLLNVAEYHIQGIEILVSWHSQDEFQGGLAILARKLIDITGAHAAFIIVEMAKKVFIIGRSSTDRINVLPIITEYNGGGHTKAASATIKDGNLMSILEAVKGKLAEIVMPAVIARQMMTTPVKTIAPTTAIEDAAKIMLRYGHTGFPVIEGDRLVGIISRRDLDKATHHGLGHAPVKGFMSKDVVTIKLDTSLEEIQNIMIEHNVGRMPVVDGIDGQQLVGIVTRTDVVEFLHGKTAQQENEEAPVDNIMGNNIIESNVNIIDKMQQQIDAQLYQLLLQIGIKADQLGYSAYIIGGVVRDLIIGNKNEDIDVVVEGNGIEFARQLAEEYGGTVRGHEKFGTATWKLDRICYQGQDDCKTDVKIDITTARREYYEYPAALPTVERSTLKEDLYRRDFTINAMAIRINSNQFGKLIDYFHGAKDITQKRIRVLYNLSFVEDPTRILRAVRFEQRFGFSMDDQTMELVYNSLDKISDVSEVRIANELRILFQEAHPVEAIERLKELGVWDYLITEGAVDIEVISMAKQIKKYFDKLGSNYNGKQRWICYLLSIFFSRDDWYDQILKFTLNNDDVEVLNHIQKLQENFQNILTASDKLGELHGKLHSFRTEAVVFVLSKQADAMDLKVIEYLKKRANIPVLITGNELKEMGIKPGPIYSTIMFDLQCAYLDEEVKNSQQVHNWVKSYILKV